MVSPGLEAVTQVLAQPEAAAVRGHQAVQLHAQLLSMLPMQAAAEGIVAAAAVAVVDQVRGGLRDAVKFG